MSYLARIKGIYEKTSVTAGGRIDHDGVQRIRPSEKLMADACRDGKMLLEVYYDSALDQATLSVLMSSRTPSSKGPTVKFKVAKFWDLIKEGLEERLAS